MNKIKRNKVDFSKHELKITEFDGVKIHELKKPGTNVYLVRFINAGGVLAVTGDCYNWIFCREFHPSSEGAVSDSYWCEKLRIASTQDPYEFDQDATKAALEEAMKDEDCSDKAREYYESMIDKVDENKEIYLYCAHENLPSCMDHESVIYRKRIDSCLEVVFDAFDEICERLAKVNQ